MNESKVNTASPNEDSESPGFYLRAALERSKKTQAQLAKKLGVSRQFIGALVSDDADIAEDKLPKVQDFLHPHFNPLEFERRTLAMRGAVITDEAIFVRELWIPIKSSKGSVTILTGKPVAFSSEKIANAGRTFLTAHKENTMSFVYPERYERFEALSGETAPSTSVRSVALDSWSLTTRQDLRRTASAITGGDPALRARIQFLRLPLADILASQRTSDDLLLILKFAQLMHPLTATTLFDGERLGAAGQTFRVGYLFVRNSDHDTAANQHAWLRLADRFVMATLEFLRALREKKQLLVDETADAG